MKKGKFEDLVEELSFQSCDVETNGYIAAQRKQSLYTMRTANFGTARTNFKAFILPTLTHQPLLPLIYLQLTITRYQY